MQRLKGSPYAYLSGRLRGRGSKRAKYMPQSDEMSAVSPTRSMATLSIVTSIATLALKFGAWWLTGSMGLLSDALETLVNVAAAVLRRLLLGESVTQSPSMRSAPVSSWHSLQQPSTTGLRGSC